jgi:hypothetical protein
MAELPPEKRLTVHAKIDSKTRLISVLGEKLFLNPLIRKRGLPPPPPKADDGELVKSGFYI